MCCESNVFESSLKVAMAPRDPLSWVTKRAGRREESISCIAGSHPIVVKKAGVSSETPGFPSERATHTHEQTISHAEKQNYKVTGGRREEETCRKTEEVNLTLDSMTRRKKGVASE